MIEYDSNGLALLCRYTGSVFPRTVPFGAFGVLIGCVVHFWGRGVLNTDNFDHPYAHQVFSISVGFLLVFRANLSYNRFWEGRTQVQQMSTKWDDAMMQIFCFEDVTKGKLDSLKFRHTMLHLFSLLHGVAIQAMRGDSDLDHLVHDVPESTANPGCLSGGHDHWDESTRSYLFVYLGLSVAERALLEKSQSRVYTVLNWVTRTITRRHHIGGLQVPPPILSRTYQVLSEGMGSYMQATKIQDTPFPFPYAQLVIAVLVCFTITAPIVIVIFVDSIVFSSILSFVSVCSSVALNEVAKEIEDPFGFDPNDLPLKKLHEAYAERILCLLDMGEHSDDTMWAGLNLDTGAIDRLSKRIHQMDETRERFKAAEQSASATLSPKQSTSATLLSPKPNAATPSTEGPRVDSDDVEQELV